MRQLSRHLMVIQIKYNFILIKLVNWLGKVLVMHGVLSGLSDRKRLNNYP